MILGENTINVNYYENVNVAKACEQQFFPYLIYLMVSGKTKGYFSYKNRKTST